MGSGISSKSKNLANQIIDLTYTELAALINGSNLIVGASYRFPFETKHYMIDGDGSRILDEESDPVIITGTTENLIAIALTNNSLKPQVYSESYPQDIIRYDWNPDNWMLDMSFADAESDPATSIIAGWKGVITYREDTKNNNILHYDFRNVKSRRWKSDAVAWSAETTYAEGALAIDGTTLYISLQADNLNHAVSDTDYWRFHRDLSITEYWFLSDAYGQEFQDFLTFEGDYEGCVFDNVFNKTTDNYIVQEINGTMLPNNVYFITNTTIKGNEINVYMTYNTISKQFYNNTIKLGCYKNIISGDMYNNLIDTEFANNIIKGIITGCNINNSCQNNLIIGNLDSNIIQGSCEGNSFYGNITYNTIGIQFQNNVIPEEATNFQNNNFKAGISNVDFTDATHVYATYNCDIFKDSLGAVKLSYIDGTTGALTVVDATA